MNVTGWIEILLFVALLTAIMPRLGGYMARVFRGEPVRLTRVLGPVERRVYRASTRSAGRAGSPMRGRC